MLKVTKIGNSKSYLSILKFEVSTLRFYQWKLLSCIASTANTLFPSVERKQSGILHWLNMHSIYKFKYHTLIFTIGESEEEDTSGSILVYIRNLMIANNNVYNFWLQSVWMHNTVSTITITTASSVFLQVFLIILQ